MLCEYSNILGEPRVGFHSYRLFDFAILDIIGTILLGILLARYYKLNYFIGIIIMFIIGILAHWLFCVDTKFMEFLNIHQSH